MERPYESDVKDPGPVVKSKWSPIQMTQLSLPLIHALSLRHVLNIFNHACSSYIERNLSKLTHSEIVKTYSDLEMNSLTEKQTSPLAE